MKGAAMIAPELPNSRMMKKRSIRSLFQRSTSGSDDTSGI
jgi:hypothetical protein